MAATVKDVFDLIKSEDLKMVDMRFIDPFGIWHHFSLSTKEFSEDAFEEGLGFDGSSIRGFQTINESDMILIPDPTSAFIDPFFEVPSLVLICDIYDPITHQAYNKDPRYISKKAEAYLKQTGIADTAFFGPEAEFFLFNDVAYTTTANTGFYQIDSPEGWWNSGGGGLGGQIPAKRGYFPCPPVDSLQDVRTQMVLTMEQVGMEVEVHHHEVGTAGQCEIDLRFDTMTRMADKLITYKYIVKQVARLNGMSATFMPKPLFEDNGSGMHVHQSLWKDGKPLFAGDKYAGLSQMALWYIGGILKHINSLLAICAPTTNSYRRLVPGYEAPVNLAWSLRNRSAACRIPMYSNSPKAKRVEFRCPDPSANPYLAFAAMLMAGLDGIKNKMDPGEPIDKNIYDLPPEEAALIPTVPGQLSDAITCLEEDHEYLLEGDVFTADFIESYIAYKRESELDPIRLRPHPYEYVLYYDC